MTLKYKKHQNNHLQNSYNKYGKENFEFKIILYCSPENLIFYEQRAINSYNFRNELYNLSPTAGSPKGYNHSEETKKKMSEDRKGINNNMYGKNHTEESKKNMSKSTSGKNHPMYGKKHTKETKKKLSEANKGRTGLNGKENPMYGKKHSEESKKKMSVSSKKINLSKKTLKKMSESKSGKNNPMYGKRGHFCCNSKSIYQIDKNTHKIIKKWNSIKDASLSLGVNEASISKVCREQQKTAGDFIWKYVEDNK